jgi:hypothetical protein
VPNLVEPVFLMPYSDADAVSDYRCVANGSATQIIFERTAFQGGTAGPTLLYVLELNIRPTRSAMEVERCQPCLSPGLVLGHRQDHFHGCWRRLRPGQLFRDTDSAAENAQHGLSDLVGGGRLHRDRERGLIGWLS